MCVLPRDLRYCVGPSVFWSPLAIIHDKVVAKVGYSIRGKPYKWRKLQLQEFIKHFMERKQALTWKGVAKGEKLGYVRAQMPQELNSFCLQKSDFLQVPTRNKHGKGKDTPLQEITTLVERSVKIKTKSRPARNRSTWANIRDVKATARGKALIKRGTVLEETRNERMGKEWKRGKKRRALGGW